MRYVLFRVTQRSRTTFSWYVYRFAFSFCGIYSEGKQLIGKVVHCARLDIFDRFRILGPSFDICTYVLARDPP